MISNEKSLEFKFSKGLARLITAYAKLSGKFVFRGHTGAFWKHTAADSRAQIALDTLVYGFFLGHSTPRLLRNAPFAC